MVKAFLANFLELGMSGGGGSYALSNDISDFFLSGLDGIADLICEQINLVLIPSLIKMNRGPRAAYPTLSASGISDKAGKELAEIFNLLATAGYVSPSDEPTREVVRQRFGLPKPDQTATPNPALASALPGSGGAPAGAIPAQLPIDDPSKTAMNGAQVTAMIEVVSNIASGRIPRDTGIAILKRGFMLTDEEAEEVLATVGDGFKPTAPPQPKTLAERVRAVAEARMKRTNP